MNNVSQPSQELLAFYAKQDDFQSNPRYKNMPGYMQQYPSLLLRFAKSDAEVLRKAIASAIKDGVIEESPAGTYHLTQSGCDWIAASE